MAGIAGKALVITGGFGALGSVVAAEAVKAGARVALVDHAPSAPPVLVSALGDKATMLGGVDLTDPVAAIHAIEAAHAAMGAIDGLINIAGGFVWQTLEDGDPAAWDRMFSLNVRTAANAARAATPFLRAGKEGRIVNIGAASAVKAGAGMGAYAAAKSGVARLTESLAEELKTQGITVNAVLPAIIDTPANRADMPAANPALWVAPSELAAVILFLASDEARAVTGALIPVTGKT
jgi:NAD(P)-dependent dehydrogenase (short-subunit alcohol dehydrogenase family)